MRLTVMVIAVLMAAPGGAALAQTATHTTKAKRGIVFVPPTGAKSAASAPAAAPAPSSAAPSEAPKAAAVAAKASCLRAYPTADVTLDGDPKAFNASLGKHLRAGEARVVVDVASPFPDDARPASLNPWLATIGRSGGVVRSVPLTCGRGFGVGHLLQKLADFFGSREPPPIYDAAKTYNAALYYDTDRMVRQIVFTPRSS